LDCSYESILGLECFYSLECVFGFWCSFDLKSYLDRKNPIGALKAFKKFHESSPYSDTIFVIKINNATDKPNDYQRFIEELNDLELPAGKFIIIDTILKDNEIKNLVRCCDSFVSLHRSEGFGKGMAEAMFFGKPVIATNYSGNLNFMNSSNSCLVNYNLISVKEGSYPYAQNQVWAEPDIEHAAW